MLQPVYYPHQRVGDGQHHNRDRTGRQPIFRLHRAQHVHGAVAMHYITGLFALDLHPGDIYWCTADPGWVTGTAYGIIAPLLLALRVFRKKDL